MAAFKLSLKVDQGATFSKVVVWKTGTPPAVVDLTGCTARMQVRGKLTDTAVLLELTTANGGIALGGAAGTVTINLSATQTAAITWVTAVYDLEIDEQHHQRLLMWVKSCFYGIQDSEVRDDKKSDEFEQRFRMYCAQARVEQERARRAVGTVIYGGI